MLIVLLRSESDVRERLRMLVQTARRPLLVAQERDAALGGAIERRQPYRYLIEHEADLTMVVVADHGDGGLWRDPVGDLAESQFDAIDVAPAVGGYILFRAGLEPTYVRRDLWDPLTDVRALVTRLQLDIDLPPLREAEPSRPRVHRAADDRTEDEIPTDPGNARRNPPRGQADPDDRKSRPRVPAPPQRPPDPFEVLGVPPTADEAAVKKAFHALVVQYHPDKVAHLAPEFQALAEQKTRELTAAYDAAQKRLRGEAIDA